MQREVDIDGNRCSFDEDDIEFYRENPLRYQIAKEVFQEFEKQYNCYSPEDWLYEFKEWLEENN